MTALLPGVQPVRLQANERCEPVSSAIRDAIAHATADLHRYPGAATQLDSDAPGGDRRGVGLGVIGPRATPRTSAHA